MTVTERQNDKFTNNYAHYTLRGAACPTLPYRPGIGVHGDGFSLSVPWVPTVATTGGVHCTSAEPDKT